MRVTVNSRGRTIFLVAVLFSLFLVALTAFAITLVPTAVESGRWLPSLAAVMMATAFVYLLVMSFWGLLYCLRYVNVSILGIFAIGTMIVAGMLSKVLTIPAGSSGNPAMETPSPVPVTLYVAVILDAIYFVAMLILLLPDAHSDLAHRAHPFVAEADLGDITLEAGRTEDGLGGIGTGKKPSTSTAPSTTQKHGKKRIKHREVSIFEDWPAPVPFPAQALYSYKTTSDFELPFSKGDQLIILDCRGNWWQAKHPKTGKQGFVPSNYIQVLQKGRVKRTFEGKDQDETSVVEGQEIEVMEVHEYMCLVRSVDGKIGSVPTDCLAIDPIKMNNLSTTGNGRSTTK
jgi:hypothetical protein